MNVKRPVEFVLPIRMIGVVEFTAVSSTENLAEFLQRFLTTSNDSDNTSAPSRWKLRANHGIPSRQRLCFGGTIRVTANLDRLEADLCEAYSLVAKT